MHCTRVSSLAGLLLMPAAIFSLASVVICIITRATSFAGFVSAA
jgi:hypothetical protein